MLNIDLPTVIFQIINFLIFFGVLYWLLFKPTMATMRKRAQDEERQNREMERERQAMAVQRAELQERLSRLEEEAASFVALAREQAEEERVALLEEAQKEVEQILAEAQADAYRVRSQAVEAFHQDLVDAILEVSGIVIRDTAPDSVHDTLVRQLSERIWELGRTNIERVEAFRSSLGEREPTAHVTTAKSMTFDQQGLIARTFTALADQHVNMEVQIDAKLIAGMSVRIGDIIVDSSISGQMQELREMALQTLKEQIGDE
jgi:F-type H+-transporting ATPase subunit b